MPSNRKGVRPHGPINLVFTEKGSDGRHRLTLNQPALKELSEIEEKLVVISAVGAYRTGKSYLLSRLAMAGGNRGCAFEVGHTSEPKTKGLWIMLLDHPSMPGHKLVLADTEGIGDTKKGDSQHDANLFVLTCLLSTIMIYNEKNAINEDTIKQFGFAAEMSKYVVSRSGQRGERDLQELFPELVYVVRDFALDLLFDGQVRTPDEYLEHALSTSAGDTTEKINIRKAITKYFGRRRCFTLDLPAASRRVLSRMDSLEDDCLNEEFVCSMKDLFAYLLKKRTGKHLNGLQLATLAETVVNSFRRKEVPNISSAMEILRKQENEKVMNKAEHLYEDGMMSLKLPTDSMDIVDETHQKLYRKAIAQVEREANLEDIEDKEIMKNFRSKLDAKKIRYKEENARKSRTLCDKRLRDLYSGIQAKRSTAYNCPGGHRKYCDDMLYLGLQFDATTGLGPMKDEVLSTFQHEIRGDYDAILENDGRLTKKEHEIKEQRLKREEAERQRKLAEKRRKEMEAVQRANEERERKNRAALEAMKKELEEAKKQRRANFLLDGGIINSAGVLAKKGVTGKYYCGLRTISHCFCCNGVCGPNNGHNCIHCQRLDNGITHTNDGKVNSAGVLAKRGTTGKYYCGLKVTYCGCCDGFCGPDNGHNCIHCQRLDRGINNASDGKVNGAGVLAKKGQTGKYYCGMRTLRPCGCCNGVCGPNNGHNCELCKRLDSGITSSSDGIINSARVLTRKGTTGKYYCGLQNTYCPCCDGFCGPTNGHNCIHCQRLDRGVF